MDIQLLASTAPAPDAGGSIPAVFPLRGPAFLALVLEEGDLEPIGHEGVPGLDAAVISIAAAFGDASAVTGRRAGGVGGGKGYYYHSQ